MSRFFKQVSRRKAGLSPGTLVPAEERKVEQVRMRLFDYDSKQYVEKEIEKIENAFPLIDKPPVSWLNVDGLHDVQILEKIGAHFDIHPLVLEDILNRGQRPKIENYEKHLFIVIKMLRYNEEEKTIQGEQVSIILGRNYVISFQETVGDIFDVIRERIRNNDSRVRKKGADYLCYRLLDTLVDHYFVILEKLGEAIEDLEDELLQDPSKETVQEIHRLKREMLYLRKSVWPLREVLSALAREDSKLIEKSTEVFLRDVYDHTIQVIDTVENFRDILAGMLDIYLSSVSNRMNEVMKVLTIMATIFIPLTFIAGIYGMNFEFMPELKWHLGYFAIWGVMLLIAISMLIYFKRKNWL